MSTIPSEGAKIFISVIGGERCKPDAARQAEAVGRELARRGAVVVCGGGRGVMEAVCRGAAAEGGLTIGILPGNNRTDANPYVKIPIVTGIGYTRNAIVVKSGQAVIAVDGSYGTLSEIAYALINCIPIVSLGSWELAIDGSKEESIIIANDPVDAVNKALKAAGGVQSCEVGGDSE